MAFRYSPKIVTDGLVLYLDASNDRSYPKTGTIWTDISRGGNNGTLTNGPTFNSSNAGCITLDGSDDYINSILSTTSFTTEATLIMFLKLANATPTLQLQTGIERISANTIKQASHYPWTDGLAYLGTFQQGSTRIDSIVLSSNINRANWHMITISSSPGTDNWKFYQNTELIKTAVGSNTISFSSDNVYNIGRSQILTSGTSYYFKGDIANIILYNRALSSTEISQNFNTLKTRFGI